MLCAIINNIKTKTLSHLYMDNNGISGYEYYKRYIKGYIFII